MTPEQANAVYDILVGHAGAYPDDRDAFVQHLTAGCEEWRFQGKLGFGGKLYVEPRRWRVDCYSEDRTQEAGRTIRATNAALDECRASFVAAGGALEC